MMVAAIALSGVAAGIGTALSPTLLVESPLLLVALNPTWRHVVLTAPMTDPVLLLLVSAARMFSIDPLAYFIGRWYSGEAHAWLEARAGRFARALRWVEEKFQKAGGVLLFLMPGGLMCVLAGSTGMRPRTFWVVAVTASVFWAAVFGALGRSLSSPIEEILAFVRQHAALLTAGTISLAFLGWGVRLWVAKKRSRGALQ